MLELNKNKTHYIHPITGEELARVSSYITNWGISPYKGAFKNSEAMQAKADYGTAVHSILEDEMESRDLGRGIVSWELQDFKKFIKPYRELERYKFSTEVSFYTDDYAGTIDLIIWDTLAKEIIIFDHKTTSKCHIEPVRLQLSLYALGLYIGELAKGEIPFEISYDKIKIGVLHYAPDRELHVKELEKYNLYDISFISKRPNPSEKDLNWFKGIIKEEVVTCKDIYIDIGNDKIKEWEL